MTGADAEARQKVRMAPSSPSMLDMRLKANCVPLEFPPAESTDQRQETTAAAPQATAGGADGKARCAVDRSRRKVSSADVLLAFDS